ncbi:MAG: hypothetical protein OEW75_08005, partial [Cyclobacteriaceae bacterium]|nr:hypothetical protein [Cyclobacteriaceae bacterium]
GLPLTISTACTSSTHAIGFASDLIKSGEATYVLAGGLDILPIETFAGFHNLGLLSKEPCTPFGINRGTTLGEGSAFLLLESEESAVNRGIQPIASFLGFGLGSDAYHDAKPSPLGYGMARALTSALSNSGLKSSDIQYINAHGTATEANDSAEWNAILKVFGKHAHKLPISSSKGHFGHVQGCAGALESITTLVSINNGAVPQTKHLFNKRPNSPTDPIYEKSPRLHEVKHAICTNAAFGGVNAALVFGKAGTTSIKEVLPKRKIGIISSGIALNGEGIEKFVPLGEIRGTDPSIRYLAGAVASTLANANIKIRSLKCENIGLFVGQERISPESYKIFNNSINERGVNHLSASAFTRMVVNNATGVCSRFFGLKGPTTTLASSHNTGLATLILSANYLSFHDDVSYLIAAAVDEPEESDLYDAKAVSILLQPETKNDIAPFYLTGWSFTSNGENARKKALKKAHKNENEVISIEIKGSLATSGLSTILSVINTYKKNETTPLLIYSKDNYDVEAAIVIERNIEYAA